MKSYCYVCRKERPCGGDDPCKTLDSDAKVKAYREGYYEKHRDPLKAASLKRYREETPDAGRHRTPEERLAAEKERVRVRNLRAENKRRERDGRPLRMSMAEFRGKQRVRDLECGDRFTRKKNVAAEKSRIEGRAAKQKSDREADIQKT